MNPFEPPTGGDLTILVVAAITLAGWIALLRALAVVDEHAWQIRWLVGARARERAQLRALAAQLGVVLPDDVDDDLWPPEPPSRWRRLRNWLSNLTVEQPGPGEPSEPDAARPTPYPRTAPDGIPASGSIKQERLTAGQAVDEQLSQFNFRPEGRRR